MEQRGTATGSRLSFGQETASGRSPYRGCGTDFPLIPRPIALCGGPRSFSGDPSPRSPASMRPPEAHAAAAAPLLLLLLYLLILPLLLFLLLLLQARALRARRGRCRGSSSSLGSRPSITSCGRCRGSSSSSRHVFSAPGWSPYQGGGTAFRPLRAPGSPYPAGGSAAAALLPRGTYSPRSAGARTTATAPLFRPRRAPGPPHLAAGATTADLLP